MADLKYEADAGPEVGEIGDLPERLPGDPPEAAAGEDSGTDLLARAHGSPL